MQLSSAVPGVANECVLTSAGDWLVVCSYTVRVGRTDLPLVSLLRPSALKLIEGRDRC